LETCINFHPKCSEFISLFIDENLKKGLKGVRAQHTIVIQYPHLTHTSLILKKTEDEIDAVLDRAITLFRFIQEKDMFERYYKEHLSKRLLYNKSVSDDAERAMITKLKVVIFCWFFFLLL